ncbi:endoplasmic reticulum metallopeptidase 1-like isoform X2 [Agrilus planipennis]|uniref:FXNA-like protease n=1 Tax=Agrilus planipennis TaxID=224129 RepID=A0A7F5R4F5_AGRPL|nr:endoplasmic reticulum metallopeptidase 1-like isoform X2 [Agrilus planipennis]
MRNRSEQKHVTFEPLTMEFEERSNEEYKGNIPSSSIHSISPLFVVFFVILLLGLFGLSLLLDSILPVPLKSADKEKYSEKFIAEEARNYLKGLTDFGPRVVVSGSYYLDYAPYGIVNAYGNVQNLIVKLSSINNNKNKSILINAHFDSVPTSPGGSDDGINCATMLEVLRVLSRSADDFEHDIIFLFNGAEESFLQASHGFITQHNWAGNCKVVINLEAAGAGGKIILFQTGPGQPWLVHKFSKVPHPAGQVTGEEIFQNNLIPSDTDFRVFRDFGGVVGYDMAFVRSGYRYHTKYDGFDNIPLGSFQHVGDNVLSLIKNLVNTTEIDNLESQDQTKVVYYDFFGLFMIVYTINVATLLNYSTALLCVIVAFRCFFTLGLRLNKEDLLYILITKMGIIVGWLLAIGFTVILGILLDYLGYTMSWYRNPWIILGLYVVPIWGLCCGVIIIANKYSFKENNSIAAHTQVQLSCVRLIWCVPLVIGTFFNIRASHIIQIPLVFNSLVFAVIHFSKLQYSVRTWQFLHLISTLIPVCYLMYTSVILMTFVIPITGRFGSNKNPELFVGFATLILSVLISSLFVPLITLVRSPLKVFYGFLITFLAFFGLVFTPLGFPYSGDFSSPAPQRFWIQHTGRAFYNINGTVYKQDAGYFIVNLDRNSPRSVENFVEDVKKAQSVNTLSDSELFYGMPILHPRAIEVLSKSSWISAEQPIIQEDVQLIIQNKENISPTLVMLNFSASGPTHMTIYFALQLGVALKNISLSSEIKEGPKWKNQTTYFINYAWGIEKRPLNFSMHLQVPQNWKHSILDIAVLGRYVHEVNNVKTPHFKQFLEEFPDWADLTPFLASFKMWKF